MSEPESPDSNQYSKAFDNMVTEGPDDIVGLLAYARYKQFVRDEAAQGHRRAGTVKNPSADIVSFYRRAAEQHLNEFAADAIDEAREEIQQSAILSAIENAQIGINSHITSSTGALRAILTNIAGWAITAFLTIIIILGLAASEVGDQLLRGIQPSNQGSEQRITPDTLPSTEPTDTLPPQQ